MAAGSVTSFPTTVVGSVGSGHDQWSSCSNALTDNGSYASVYLSKGQDSDDLCFGGFDFSSIPANATIDSITVTFEAHASASGQVVTGRVRVSQPGVSTFSDYNSYWPTSDTQISTAGPSGIWGASGPWNPTNDLGANFAVALACVNEDDTKRVWAYVDYLKVTVAYHT